MKATNAIQILIPTYTYEHRTRLFKQLNLLSSPYLRFVSAFVAYSKEFSYIGPSNCCSI